jgi:hypothetical protein
MHIISRHKQTRAIKIESKQTLADNRLRAEIRILYCTLEAKAETSKRRHTDTSRYKQTQQIQVDTSRHREAQAKTSRKRQRFGQRRNLPLMEDESALNKING